MYLAYSTNGFTRRDLARAIRRIAGHGYAGVELLADAPHWSPSMDGPEVRRAVREALSETGLGVSNVNANTAASLWPFELPEPVFEPSLSNHDPAVRRRRLEYTRACLDFAAEVGAPCVSVTSGRPEALRTPEDGMAWFADGLAAVCDHAASVGVRVGIEYEPGLLVETAGEVLGILRRVDHPLLGVNLDVGHAICAGEDPAASIRKLGPWIWNVHLEDIRGRKHHHLVPGEGDVDFGRVFAALRDVGHHGYVTVELYTCVDRADDAAAQAHAHLAPYLEVEATRLAG